MRTTSCVCAMRRCRGSRWCCQRDVNVRLGRPGTGSAVDAPECGDAACDPDPQALCAVDAVDLFLDAGGHDLHCCFPFVVRCLVGVVIAGSTDPVLAPDSGNDRTSATSSCLLNRIRLRCREICMNAARRSSGAVTPSTNRRQKHPKWSWSSSNPRPTDYHRTDASSSQRCVSSFVRQWF